MNPGEAVKMDTEYRSFLAELGGGPQPELGGGGGGPPQRGAQGWGGGRWAAPSQARDCSRALPPLHPVLMPPARCARRRCAGRESDACKLYVGNLSPVRCKLQGGVGGVPCAN